MTDDEKFDNVMRQAAAYPSLVELLRGIIETPTGDDYAKVRVEQRRKAHALLQALGEETCTHGSGSLRPDSWRCMRCGRIGELESFGRIG